MSYPAPHRPCLMYCSPRIAAQAQLAPASRMTATAATAAAAAAPKVDEPCGRCWQAVRTTCDNKQRDRTKYELAVDRNDELYWRVARTDTSLQQASVPYLVRPPSRASFRFRTLLRIQIEREERLAPFLTTPGCPRAAELAIDLEAPLARVVQTGYLGFTLWAGAASHDVLFMIALFRAKASSRTVAPLVTV